MLKISFFKKNAGLLTRLSFIVISILLIILLFPHEGKFKYEYKQGSPWKYENLIAQNNFPIYKTEAEFNAEKDSTLKKIKPYFNFNSKIKNTHIAHFITEFELEIDNLIENTPEIQSNKRIIDSLHSIKQQTINTLREIYSYGIIEKTYPQNIKINSQIIIFKNKIGDEYLISDLYTQKKAYKYITDKYNKLCENRKFKTPSISFEKYVLPNVFYDEKTTEQEKKQLIDEISPARGMVQAGEAIIFKGELINAHKFSILESLKKEYTQTYGTSLMRYSVIIGEFILFSILMSVLFLYIYFYNIEILQSTKQTLFILTSMMLPIAIHAVFVKFNILNVYIIPEIILPIITVTFYKPRLAFIHNTVTILIISFFVSNSFEYLIIQFIASFTAISLLAELSSRSQILKTALIILISYILSYSAYTLIHGGSIQDIDLEVFIWFLINSILVLMAYPLIYLFEKVFGFISEVTLLELSNTNKPLLRLLAEKAPGTFQHSVQVANIAEEVAREIGANPLLIRAGALYHDIGKISNPIFFTENQNTNKNPHDSLDPLKSCEIILNHIKNGVEIAKKYNLPKEIIDFIVTHQGTGKIRWFLEAYKEKNKGKHIDEDLFKYSGPKPNSKETAILMMTDSLEAASRSLKIHNHDTINKLVENIINYQISENQFDDADITFAEISKIKAIIKEKLKNIYHTRIEYPK